VHGALFAHQSLAEHDPLVSPPGETVFFSLRPSQYASRGTDLYALEDTLTLVSKLVRDSIDERVLLSILSGALTPSDISRDLRYSVQYVGRILTSLAKRGLVRPTGEKLTWKSITLTDQGKSLALSLCVARTRDPADRDYFRTDPSIVGVLDGKASTYLTLPMTSQLPYLPLFTEFNSGQLRFCGDYTLALTARSQLGSLSQFLDYLRILERSVNTFHACFTLYHSREDLVLGWGITNLVRALQDTTGRGSFMPFALFLDAIHPTLIVGDYHDNRITFSLLIASWYIPENGERDQLQRLLRLAGSRPSGLFPIRLESTDSLGIDARATKIAIFHYANRSFLSGTEEGENRYAWIVGDNPVPQQYRDNEIVRRISHDVFPIIPLYLFQTYEKKELKEAVSFDNFWIQYVSMEPPAGIFEVESNYHQFVVMTPHLHPRLE
jgi:hypothetical protein